MQLAEVVGTELRVDPGTLDDDSSPMTVDGWDSLIHLSIISAIEETYSVEFSAAEMRDAMSVGQLRRLLKAKGVEV